MSKPVRSRTLEELEILVEHLYNELADKDTAKERRDKHYLRLVKATLIHLYGENCMRCGGINEVQLDHIVPRRMSVSSSPVNFQLLCRHCNVEKGEQVADYRYDAGTAIRRFLDSVHHYVNMP